MNRLLRDNIKNLRGWRTPRKLVAFAVDDFANARVSSSSARDRLAPAGLDLSHQMGRFDSLETRSNLEALFVVLDSVKDSGGNPANFTLIDETGAYSVLGCRLRISVDSRVEDLAAVNLAVLVDDETGMVCGPGVYSDITRHPESVHPVTGTPIEGFQIPLWQEALEMVERAIRMHPENCSIGWDVVITPDGPGLIEGNHDWCKLVWQLPVRRGLKHLLIQCDRCA